MSNRFETQFEEAKESPGFIFWKAANLHQRLQRQVLKNIDITPSQFSVLASYFFAQDRLGPVTQAQICEHTALDKMHVSDITKSLISKKYVQKLAHEEDGRSFRICVTDKGAKVCNEAVKRIEKLDDEFFGKTENVKQFTKMLLKLLNI